MAAYEFVTIWRVHAPKEKVWDEIYYSEKWPEWWPGVEEVTELKEGDELGVGSIRRYTWRSKLPYKLTFNVETVRVEPIRFLKDGHSESLREPDYGRSLRTQRLRLQDMTGR